MKVVIGDFWMAFQDFEWVSVTAGLVPGRGRGSRFRASRSDPSGPCLAEAFRNSFGRGCAQPRCLSQFRLSIQATPRWGPRSFGEVSAHPCPRPCMIQPTPQESVGFFRLQGAPLQTGTQGTRAWWGDMPLRAVRARGPRLWQASPAAVRSGGPSEARPALPVGLDRAGSGAPAFRCGGWGEPQPGRRALQQRGEPDDPLHLEEQWVPRGSPRPDGEQTTHTIS